MQQLQQSWERQPFFKPLSGGDGSNGFTFGDGSNTSQQLDAQMSTSTKNASFFMTPTQQSLRGREMEAASPLRIGQGQNQEVSSERISTLHTRLHQEADKVRKWKIQTEYELKQKEGKLQEANQTVQSFRKSVLELQIQNENLSLKLQEEIENREEILEKINSTRDMCSALKNHASMVEDGLQKCEKEKAELQECDKEKQQKLQDLTERFNHLEIASSNDHHSLVNQLKAKEEESGRQNFNYEQRILHLENKLKELEVQCGEKETVIGTIKEELRNNHRNIVQLEEDKARMQEKIVESDNAVTDQKLKIEVVSTELKVIKDKSDRLQQFLDETNVKLEESIASKEKLAKNFDETEKLYIEKVDTLKKTLDEKEHDLSLESQRMDDARSSLTRTQAMIEDLKSSKDMLILEKTEIQNCLRQLEVEKLEISKRKDVLEEDIVKAASKETEHTTQIKDLEKECKLLQERVDELNCEIQDNTKKIRQSDEYIKEMENRCQEKQTEIMSVGKELEDVLEKLSISDDKVEHFSSMAESQNIKYSNLVEKYDKLKDEKQSLQKEFNASKREIAKTKKDIEKILTKEENAQDEIGQLLQRNEELSEAIEELKADLENKTKELDDLKKQQENNAKNLEHELQNTAKSAASLETKTKTMKGELLDKNKAIKDLEKEVKQLKSKLTSQTKLVATLEDETKTLENDLKEKETELQTSTKDLECKENDIAKLEKSMDKISDETKKAKRESENAVKAKNEACLRFEHQMGEMTATLEKYKKENQKIVEKKERELEEIKGKLEKQMANKEQECTINDLRQQVDNLKTEIEKSEKEKVECKKQAEERKQHIKELKSIVQKQEEELKALHSAVEEQKADVEKMRADAEKNKENIKVPSTPSLPKTPVRSSNVKMTPKGSTQKVASVTATPKQQTPVQLKTPQRSILKQTNSVSKRRKVMFAQEQDDGHLSDESSSSELMEVEIDELENRLKKPTQNVLPLHVRPSPKIRASPSVSAHNRKEDKNVRTPLKPVARGPSAQTPKKSFSSSDNAVEDEQSKFKELFAEEERNSLCHSKKHVKKLTGTPNVRKAPSKMSGKFFKSSPKDRKRLLHRKDTADLSWFDSDAVFGFGPED